MKLIGRDPRGSLNGNGVKLLIQTVLMKMTKKTYLMTLQIGENGGNSSSPKDVIIKHGDIQEISVIVLDDEWWADNIDEIMQTWNVYD